MSGILRTHYPLSCGHILSGAISRNKLYTHFALRRTPDAEFNVSKQAVLDPGAHKKEAL